MNIRNDLIPTALLASPLWEPKSYLEDKKGHVLQSSSSPKTYEAAICGLTIDSMWKNHELGTVQMFNYKWQPSERGTYSESFYGMSFVNGYTGTSSLAMLCHSDCSYAYTRKQNKVYFVDITDSKDDSQNIVLVFKTTLNAELFEDWFREMNVRETNEKIQKLSVFVGTADFHLNRLHIQSLFFPTLRHQHTNAMVVEDIPVWEHIARQYLKLADNNRHSRFTTFLGR